MTTEEGGSLLKALKEGTEAALDELLGRYGALLLDLAAHDPSVVDPMAPIAAAFQDVIERLDELDEATPLQVHLVAALRAHLTESAVELAASADGPATGYDSSWFEPAGDVWEGHWKTGAPGWRDLSEPALAAARSAAASVLDSLDPDSRQVVTLRDGWGWTPADLSLLFESEPEAVSAVLNHVRWRLLHAVDQALAASP